MRKEDGGKAGCRRGSTWVNRKVPQPLRVYKARGGFERPNDDLFYFFLQNAAISYLLIIPKCRECQEPATAAIFTVLTHSQRWPTDGTPERD